MTIIERILNNAEAYPDRLAIIAADGSVTLYGELARSRLFRPMNEYSHTTSGTTGAPKKIVVTDSNLQRRLTRIELARPWLSSVMKLFLPIPAGAPIGRQLLSHMLLKGGTVYQAGVTDALSAVMRRCGADQVDAITFVPKVEWHWQLVEQAGDYRFPYVFVSGAAITAEQAALVYARLGKRIYVNYAASEVGQIAGADYEDVKHIPGCVGRVVQGVEVKIIGGQVAFRCDTIIDGYRDDSTLTTQRFIDGWFYSGDLGHFEDDLLVIDGRV